jgi:ParB-like chromosome segregation protein Spo0J
MGSSFERFEVIEIERKEIKNAPYNPRVITPGARKRLQAGIKKLGLLGPITWNKRTGNIVSGHQRLKILDQITPRDERNEDGGYNVTVAAVDLNDIQEREANLLMNNDAAQGQFEVAKVGEMLKFPGLALAGTGWESSDLMRLLGSDPLAAPEATIAETPDGDDVGNATIENEDMRAAADRIAKAVEQSRAEGVSDYFLVVVFPSYAARLAFTDALKLDDNRYQSASDLTAAITEHGLPPEPDQTSNNSQS